jgi:hypothetical protein
MKLIRKNFALKFLWMLLALHILNCSIDAPDAKPNYIPEDLSYNEVESITEYVLEHLFDLNNIVNEQEDTDENDSFSAKKTIDLSHYQQGLNYILSYFFSKFNFALYSEVYSEIYHPELVPPPPKA